MEQKLAALYQDQSVIAASAQLKSCWLRHTFSYLQLRSFMFSRKKWTFAQIVDYCFSILLLFNECSLVFIDIHKMTDMLLPWLCFFYLLLIIVYFSTLNDIFYTIFVSFPCASNLWNTCICIQCCWKRSLTVFEGICTWGLRLILSRTICRLN